MNCVEMCSLNRKFKPYCMVDVGADSSNQAVVRLK